MIVLTVLFCPQFWFKLKTTLGADEAKKRPNAFVKDGFINDHYGFKTTIPCFLSWLRSANCFGWRDKALESRAKLYGLQLEPVEGGGGGGGGADRSSSGTGAFARPTTLAIRETIGGAPTTLPLRKTFSSTAAATADDPGEVTSDFDEDDDEEARKRGKRVKRAYNAARKKDPTTRLVLP